MPKGKYKRRNKGQELQPMPGNESVTVIDTRKTVEPARTEQRICFGIMWFTNEEDAAVAHAAVRQQGRTFNGGYFDGMACGRAPEWDYQENGVQYFAVTN